MGKWKDSFARRWKSGISLNIMNFILLTVGVIVGVSMIYSTYQSNDSFQNMAEITELYMSSQSEAGMLEDLSKAMLTSSQGFLSSGELGLTKTFYGQYSAAVAQAGAEGTESATGRVSAEAGESLLQARAAFHQMMEKEAYAMRLKADTLPIPLSKYPEALQAVELTEEDQAKTEEEKLALAAELISSPEFESIQQTLTEMVDASHRTVSGALQQRTTDSAEMLAKVVHRQKVLVFVFLAVAILALLLNSFLVLQPMRRSVKNLDSGEQIPIRGSYEMRHLAQVYNDVLQDNEKKNTELAFTATHDALTGLYNRAAFDKAYKLYGKGHVGILICDVDYFKHFNDDYGHDVGDLVLKTVANRLKQHFRAEDHISRIGGDEFCVIMLNMGSEQVDLVKKKIDRINEQLQDGDGEVPPITISAGVAFWDRENPGKDIFKDADIALLDVKKHGRVRCGVYPVSEEKGS